MIGLKLNFSFDEIVVDDHGFGYKEILDLCEKSQYF